MDFVIEGHKINQRGVENEFSSNPLIVGMNVVQACWDVMFHNPSGPLSFSCQNPKFQNAWRTAVAACCRTVVTTEDGFLGYVWPSQCQGVTVPARSEVVIWGRATGAISAIQTLAVVSQGQGLYASVICMIFLSP